MKIDVQSDSRLEAVLQRIFYYENHAGITVRDVASLTGKHPRQVYHYISGEREPDPAFLRTLSQYMIETYGDDRVATFFLPIGCRVIRGDEPDCAKVSSVLHILEQAIANVLQILLMDDGHAAEIEADAIIRLLGEIRRQGQTDHAGRRATEQQHRRTDR